MENYFEHNKELWNESTPIHVGSVQYDVAGFKAGKTSLKTVESAEVGDVKGKRLLHLQCHFGMDTLSWARLGAKVTGVDFSDAAIAQAKALSAELSIPADFICGNIYDLPGLLKGKFDIVFTSSGVLCWLPDLPRWAGIIAHYLKQGGFFYIAEFHPVLNIFDNSKKATGLRVTQSYFHKPEPTRWEPEGDYADPGVVGKKPSYEWTHSLGDILNALIGAGLRINFLHEFPTSENWNWAPFTKQDAQGYWRVEGGLVPFVFSLKATRPRGRTRG